MATPQNREIPMICPYHARVDDARPCVQVDRTTDRIRKRYSKPNPVHNMPDRNMPANHGTTTNPQNTNNPNTPPSSTIAKPTTQNTRTTDQTGKHRTKSEPVHTHAGPCPAANHGIIAEARNHGDLITPSQSTAGMPGTQNTRTTDPNRRTPTKNRSSPRVR